MALELELKKGPFSRKRNTGASRPAMSVKSKDIQMLHHNEG
jgi:hypothetical protein